MVARRVLFVAACLALVTSAFSFQMRQDISDQWAHDFALTKEVVGTVLSAAFLGMAVSMLIFSPLAETFGLGRVMALAFVCHLTGIFGTLFAPQLAGISAFETLARGIEGVVPAAFAWSPFTVPETEKPAYWLLWFSTFLVGCGNGLTEVWINPLAASLYPDQKTHKLNVLHAWWPGGLMIAGLLAVLVINPAVGFDPQQTKDPETITLSWKVKIGMLLIPLALYALLCVGRRFPVTERVEANVPTVTMLLQVFRPLFLILAFCMLLTAATELGPNSWQQSVLKRTANVSGTMILVYTSFIMFILRFFAGHIVERISPITMMMFSAIITSAGLFLLSFANDPFTAFAAATVFGVGITYFWPTMLGVTAERFPKGGAMLIGLMGCVGNLSIAYVLPQIGKIYDSYTVYNIPADVQTLTFRTADNEIEKVILDPPAGEQQSGAWMPEGVRNFLYPEGARKLNPKLTEDIRQQQLGEETREVLRQAEAQGAAYAFRRVAILPAILVVIFGLIALVDRLRGGYRVVHITEGHRTG